MVQCCHLRPIFYAIVTISASHVDVASVVSFVAASVTASVAAALVLVLLLWQFLLVLA